MKNIDQIKAVHLRNWSNKNCKFQPGAIVKGISRNASYYLNANVSKKGANLLADGNCGRVIAVSCTPDGKIRGRSKSGGFRQFTRYYIQFSDGQVFGVESNELREVCQEIQAPKHWKQKNNCSELPWQDGELMLRRQLERQLDARRESYYLAEIAKCDRQIEMLQELLSEKEAAKTKLQNKLVDFNTKP